MQLTFVGILGFMIGTILLLTLILVLTIQKTEDEEREYRESQYFYLV